MDFFEILLFGGAAAFYTLAAIAHLFYMFRRDFGGIARWATRIAWIIQTGGLALLLVDTGRLPVYSQFEFAFFFTWVMMTNYIVVEVWRDNQSAGSFLLPVIAVLQVATIALEKPSAETWVLDFPFSLIVWHVGVIMLGYAFLVASFVAGALYLLQERNLRRKKWGPLYYRLPSLEALDRWSGWFVYIGFPLLTIGMGAGMLFAHVRWETFWTSDPKVLFTTVVWLLYGLYLVVRQGLGWGGRKAAWLSVIGVTGLLINYFVMNMLSPLHRFGV